MKKIVLFSSLAALLYSCSPTDFTNSNEDPSTFTEIASTTIGGEGAAEISAFDPVTKKLFVVTNTNVSEIDILDLSNPAAPVIIGHIDIAPYGGGVNSVAVYDGKLAAAVEGYAKTDNGKVVVFKTTDYSLVKEVTVGALPDMVTYTYDGKYILSANEGEPDGATYTIDPVGSVSIIHVAANYAVTTLDFSAFEYQLPALKAKGFRIYGPNASFAQDIEPEYIAVSDDSKTAWVTLQENNAIAKIDIRSRRIEKIMPLGFKNYSLAGNEIDPGDKDGGIIRGSWPVKGMYEPDALAVYVKNGFPYVFTANEGDAREWGPYVEIERIKNLSLDPSFPATLKQDAQLGRLNITKAMGDTDGDGDFDELYSLGGRSFSVWNGNTGDQIFDSGNELEDKCIAAGFYDDGRSDDKGVEPEGVTLGMMGRKQLAFVGMERADAVAIYDISNPAHPKFIKILATGDAPEGVLFVPAKQSPSGKSLLIVSSENDGVIKIYQVN